MPSWGAHDGWEAGQKLARIARKWMAPGSGGEGGAVGEGRGCGGKGPVVEERGLACCKEQLPT
jgi:hypothetical protein